MKDLLVILVTAVVCGSVTAQDEIRVHPAHAVGVAFPCGNDPKLFVQTYIVSDYNNNWEGVFYMDQFIDVQSVRLQVTLENPASLTLKNTLGNVLTNDNQTFLISTFKIPPEIRRIEFKVKGLSPGFFPHLISLGFNNNPLCDNTDRELAAPFMQKSKKCGKVLVAPHQGLIANANDASPVGRRAGEKETLDK